MATRKHGFMLAIACVLGLTTACSELQEVFPGDEKTNEDLVGVNIAGAPSNKTDEGSIFSSLPFPLTAAALNPAPDVRNIRPSRNTRQIVPKPEFFEGSQESLRAFAGDRICFVSEQTELDALSRDTLKRVASWLDQNPGRGLVLEGHAKQHSTREYSVGISEHRTNLVASFLKEVGVPDSRLKSHAFGKERANVFCKGDFTAVYLISVRGTG